ncbi:MAG TPA: amino acid adenylation domain-containing protein, partial [Thermoanaerobaculia bacterium]|nr:amino acid adenylation domain-containing protein [Thermoanaerobaculia bacterium]
NTLVMRADLSGSPGFAALLGRIRQVALDAFAHQDLPFERLVEELAPERDLSRSPLFQVFFVLQNAPAGIMTLPGLALSPVPVESGLAKFDLSLSLQEVPAGLAGSLEYNTDLFDPSTAARLLARLEGLLEAAFANPALPLAELPLLLTVERHQAILEWNDTAAAHPAGARLHELVAAQAERTPQAVAVSFEGESLTYRELVSRARRLAWHLLDLGVQPDGRVGVLLERSPEMSVALLGILQAGAAYVPLDPTHPAERLAILIESSGARVVLAQARLRHLLPGRGERAVFLDEGWEEIASRPDTAPAIQVGEENLAYVMFTSGSTGAPKGVMIPHRGIVNRLVWMQETYRLRPEDRILQKTPFSFDVSLWELFSPLLAGARLVYARPEAHKDPAYLVDLISQERITAVHFVPSMLQAFLETPGVSGLTSLRLVTASGEALPPDVVRRFYGRISGVELHNLYGPTEASVEVSVWPCVPEPPRSVVPIGRPISNTRLHVVDRDLRPQPPGVPGELLLGGVGLARGYLDRPDLTAAAFVPDSFGPEPGGRLYRTGDLARHLPDGNVEFLGRIDHQVKIRGFRIELGEIEAVLARHPSVRECVVLAREDSPGNRFLAAYVTGRPDAPPAPGELRSFLGERLPESMVPAAFVVLDALPLNPNGKVDRKALPAPERTGEEAEGFVAPGDPVEELLADLWAEVLRTQRVGKTSNFFELGGHSLLATQVMSRIRNALGVSLS